MLQQSLAQIVGPANVLADEAARRYASSDIFVWPDAVVADLVVRPGSTTETARAVSLLNKEAKGIVPRGAGLSYTAGVVPHAPAVVVDTARLDAIEIHADDLYAVVGAGCTWEKVAAALKPSGLQAVQRSPISGSHSTVGGLASQNLPGGMDGVIGLTVVLADGTVARTGSAARTDASPFQRYSGPDLTGVFLGDCGAFGIKTEVVLRLAPEQRAAFASFGFADGEELTAAVAALMRRLPGIRAFALDQARGAAASRVEAGEAAKILGAVVKGAGSLGQAVKDVAQLARGRNALGEHPWSLHLTSEAATETAALAQLDRARKLLADQFRAAEIDNVVPKTLRAKPYSIRGLVGPAGERWVPVHGVLPLSRARACMADLRSHLDSNAEALARAGVSAQWLVSSTGPYVTIEPLFYWRDALDPIQLAHLSKRNRARFAGGAENQAARELVRRLRAELREVFARHGAVHAQVGRFYRLIESMDPGSRDLVSRIKRALDPDGHMNPGALGL
ncbi:MAG TPA: FAD-binding oxidoreductase [Burkholderiales bacterium]|nr:FAD-binding oxidoreductase [Burkholderiales bacterium]